MIISNIRNDKILSPSNQQQLKGWLASGGVVCVCIHLYYKVNSRSGNNFMMMIMFEKRNYENNQTKSMRE